MRAEIDLVPPKKWIREVDSLPPPHLAYGRLSRINILADKPIPAERSEPGGRDGFIAKILES